MRKKKLFYNTISSLIQQITTIICGFILPRVILGRFGSEVNGLVNSIVQFLSIISFLELGVGAVVQSSLYKPLSEDNKESISKIMVSANKFFTGIGRILFVYLIVLVIAFPRFAGRGFDYWYTATLIIAISISMFAEYFFGIVNRLLLTADQRGYIHYNSKTIAVILNTAVCFALIKWGYSIQLVKLVSSMIFLIQPIALNVYVKKHYSIDKKIRYDEEPIKQKWNGIAQHVAASVLDDTDTIVLTVFATLSDVSIYSVYYMVVKGIKRLFLSMINGITSLIGELWAKQELEELNKTFSWTEWVIHTGTTFIFGITAILIVPFVKVYTLKVDDANYIQPVFAALLVAAHASHCLRQPYNIVILAGGHYKQTQRNYIIAAVLNIVVSIATVKVWGLVGVAIGTLVAMLYQTVWMAIYDSKNLIKWPIKNFLKQLFVDALSITLMVASTWKVTLQEETYLGWIVLALLIAVISLAIVIVVNLIFYREKLTYFWKKLIKKVCRN